MDTEFRLLYPKGYKESDQARMKSYDFITSLQIDDMVVLQNDRYRGYSELTLGKVFFHRSGSVRISAGNRGRFGEASKVVSGVLQFGVRNSECRELRRVLSSDFSVDSALSAVRYLEMYEELVDVCKCIFGD